MSLTFAYCENIKRWRSPPQASLWGLKNNQTRKKRFFRWFLTFVVIKSNLDAFTLRHIAVNLLGKEKSQKLGTKSKRFCAGWDDEYLEKILECI